jgi:hypothetical protein
MRILAIYHADSGYLPCGFWLFTMRVLAIYHAGSGYYRCILTSSVKYTGFSTPDGHFEFLKMPFS